MTVKRWIYSLLPADSPKGYARYIHNTLDEAIARACPNGTWIKGGHVEVCYEGVKEDEGFEQREFIYGDRKAEPQRFEISHAQGKRAEQTRQVAKAIARSGD